MQKKIHEGLGPDSLVAAFNIPYLDVVAEDVFLLFPERSGEPGCDWGSRTVAELAAAANLKCDEALALLGPISKWSEGVLVDPGDLSVKGRHGMLYDVSASKPSDRRLKSAGAKWFYDLDPAKWFERACRAENCGDVFICLDGRKSFSAAMYFRQQGLATARSVQGGWRLLDQLAAHGVDDLS